MVVEIILNNKSLEPKFYTGIQGAFEINDKIIFPLRYCDLAPISIIGITLYDMKKPFDESVIAGTTIDLFDEKMRLRQGTIDLYLWPKVKADPSLQTKTPGLLRTRSLEEINILLSKINMNQKHQNGSTKDPREWLDK